MIPGAMLATFLINTALTSAAGVTAAVGVVLIPAMMAAGVHPAMAAAAVFAGSWGSIFSPGSPHPAVIAKIADVPVISVILAHQTASIAAVLLAAVLLFFEAKLFRQDRDWTPEKAGATLGDTKAASATPLAQVSVIRALIPMAPLALLLVTVPQFGLTTRWLPNGLSVLQSMVIGVVLAMVVTRANPKNIVNRFFAGMGDAYSGVIGIIIAAGVFIGGLDAVGAIDTLISVLKNTQSVAPIFATFGPMVLGFLSGSGDAATLAFNNAVTPHAAQFGMTPIDLGNLAWLGGAFGRTMSPVAAAGVVAAGFAGVSPFEVAKRNAIPMLAAAIVALVILGW
jgi:DcuC family C4-dicarboxylate transporter